ncbi:MAG TPA: YHS domain-containing (seleno)protein [Paracoccus sp. (in: a-proteobacteria)]|uniref:YHS domain-containing (seleno)protein n=1 Tax=Paracoccus sp. TaxID=267 RepID=UPI002B636573|nr:YHS domain-containing (seleno)protein [Paracoccus sp. (in: a-proteobacteria)]HWL58476.1 YHS domain-containing (seleno)protein [Paracoccus sp. (in: a-proteobacteria)]
MIRLAALLVSLSMPASGAMAQDWALDGMDPVSYGRDNAAVPGRSDIVTLWRGKSWHFANEDNRTLFEANPRAFAPGLNGLCVVALSEGRSEPGNPRHFVIIGHRTYLLRSEAARRRLLADPQHVLMQAKAVWARLNP